MTSADMSVLELDFSRVPRSGLTMDQLKAYVSSQAPRHWVSMGLEAARCAMVEQLDREVVIDERRSHAELMAGLRTGPDARLGANVRVDTLYHRPTDTDFVLSGMVPVLNPRNIRGFMLADIPGAPRAVVTTLDAPERLTRLFAWHESIKTHPLTVVSMSGQTVVHSKDLGAIRAIALHLKREYQAPPQPIGKATVPDWGIQSVDLETPITQAFISSLDDRAYVELKVHEDLARKLIGQQFADAVISIEENQLKAYISRELARQFNVIRPPNDFRDALVGKIENNRPCLVRFVPSVAERLKGNLFNYMVVFQGEVYFDDPELGASGCTSVAMTSGTRVAC